ncbi:hypothetical protein [uncultured Holdemanella sp.]|uniref:hypothetical protein n=1 Tax=uncultured Holdemanella sp. TaxID=1763549 RepID=UPI00280596E3|nr:hypothetical protein [uncultured Holdemanella sp.]
MAKMKRKRVASNKPTGQGHKLVWFTVIIILIPVVIVGYVLLTSVGGQNHPVEGNRFSKTDLNPAITDNSISSLESSLASIDNVEKASVNLLSATLRVHIDLVDSATDEVASQALDAAYNVINDQLPIDTYFTNKDDSKMYDLEIDAYNYLIDDTHTTDGWTYLKLTKTGASKGSVTDNMTTAKDPELSSELKAASDQIQQNIANAQNEEDGQ